MTTHRPGLMARARRWHGYLTQLAMREGCTNMKPETEEDWEFLPRDAPRRLAGCLGFPGSQEGWGQPENRAPSAWNEEEPEEK